MNTLPEEPPVATDVIDVGASALALQRSRRLWAVAAVVSVALSLLSYHCAHHPLVRHWAGGRALGGAILFAILAFVGFAAAISTSVAAVIGRLTSPLLFLASIKVRSEARVGEATWACLAGMRMFLATIVVCGHLTDFFRCNRVVTFVASLSSAEAVLLFLFISGFSIANSVARDTSQYYARRFWRIVPVYLSCVAVSFLPFLFKHHLGEPFGETKIYPDSPGNLIVSILSFGFLKPIISDGPTWSLGVEVVWYLLAPFIKRFTPYAMVGLIVCSWLAVRFLHVGMDRSEGSWTAFGSVSFGWLAGYLFYYNRHRLIAYVLLFLTAQPLIHGHSVQIPAIFTVIVFASVFIWSLKLGKLPEGVARFLNLCGDISYPLYLCHFPVFWLFLALGVRSPGLATFSAFLLAGTIYVCVDKPARSYSRSLLKGKASQG